MSGAVGAGVVECSHISGGERVDEMEERVVVEAAILELVLAVVDVFRIIDDFKFVWVMSVDDGDIVFNEYIGTAASIASTCCGRCFVRDTLFVCSKDGPVGAQIRSGEQFDVIDGGATLDTCRRF